MTKRVWQPKKLKRKRAHGYRSLTSTKNGKKVIKRRTLKGRKRITAV